MASDDRRRLRKPWRWAWPLVAWALLALAGCGAALQAEDSQTQGLIRRAREQYDAKQFGSAEGTASDALRRAADNPQALYVRGLARVAQRQYATGRDDLEQAQKADPMLLFAANNKAEFDNALRLARENTMTALDGQPGKGGQQAKDAKGNKATTPKSGALQTAATAPVPPATSGSPLKSIIEDQSGAQPTKIGPDQLKVLRTALEPIEKKGLWAKVLVVKAGLDPVAEAKRLHESAKQGPQLLVAIATLDGKLGLYHPSLTGDEAADLVAKAAAANAKESLARQLVAVLQAVAPKLKAPAAVPEPKPLPTLPTPPPPVAPPPPGPAPWMPYAAGAGGLAALLLVLLALRRMVAARRLARGFGQARPQLTAVAAGLASVAAGLRGKRDRAAEVAQQAAELAYFDALAMMSQASEGKVADTARVERAVRLLDEAQAKISEAQTALATAPERANAVPGYCFFSARLLPDTRDADRVELRRGEQRLVVLASREAGEVLRRGGVPEVRLVNGKHWSLAPGFEPETDFYSDRHGRTTVPATALPWTFSGDEAVFVESRERPDYKLDLG